MSTPLRLHQIALASVLALQMASGFATPLKLSKAPANSNRQDPAPNVILSIDDSASMKDPLDPKDPNSRPKVELLRESLREVFGDGTPNSGIVPDGRIRLAWHAMHNHGGSPGANSLTPGAVNAIRPFVGRHRENFNAFVDSIVPQHGTPALELMGRVRDYVRTSPGLDSPWADNPGTPQNTSTKPYLTCRRTYNVLLSDGSWNSQRGSDRVAAGDATHQTLGDGRTRYVPFSAQTRLYSSEFGDNNTGASSTLADFAFDAWATDAQPSIANEVKPLMPQTKNERFTIGAACRANKSCIATEPFWNPRNNPATWQSVSLYTIGFGHRTVNWTFRKHKSDDIFYTDRSMFDESTLPTEYEKECTRRMRGTPPTPQTTCRDIIVPLKKMATAADKQARKTALDWSENNRLKDTFGGDLAKLIHGDVAWPNPKTQVGGFNSEVEDTRPAELWHAAVNGRGRYYPVTTPSGLTDAFTNILGQVIRDTSTPLVSIATNSNQLQQGMFAYIGGYSAADGAGILVARPIDQATGMITSGTTWNAAELLDARSAAEINNRVVLTSNGSSGIPFKKLSQLSDQAKQALNRDANGDIDNLGQLRINYLRGDQTLSIDADGEFRNRASRLGAIVNSNVLYVGAPAAVNGLGDKFANFASAQRGREAMLYVGASDGMLHGFQASNGVERLAYVPLGLAEGKLRKLTDATHELEYFVDGSPFAGNAHLGTDGWRTLLVGTGGNGFKGWFVLDITDPGNFSDRRAASVVHTDRTADNNGNIGHIVSDPSVDETTGQSRQIVKLNNGRWAAVLGNGVNSVNEAPVLMLQYLDGDRALHQLSPCPTPIAQADCDYKGNNGLSTPAVVDINGDGVADLAYAGDIRGNVWKFDLRGSNANNWGVSFGGSPFFVASHDGRRQPITSAPLVAPHPAGGLMVVVGTGRNLTDGDAGTTYQQSVYGLWDNSTYGTNPTGSAINKSSLVQQAYNATPFADSGSKYFVSSDQPVNFTGSNAHRGWYLDLPVSGQRVVSGIRPYAGQKVMVESMIPAQGTDLTKETCSPTSSGGRRFLSVLNLFNGGVPDTPPFTFSQTLPGSDQTTMIETAPGQSALFRAGPQIKHLSSNCQGGKSCAANTWNPGQTLGARAAWRQVLQ
jgi:type IV pilus assembly protein PilY1